MNVLMITSEWPTPEHPEWAPFITREVQTLREAGVNVQVFPFRGGKNPLKYLVAWVNLRRLHPLKQFDLVHAQYGQSGLLALPSKIPLVVTLRGSDLHGIVGLKGNYQATGSLLRLISQQVAKCSQEVILVSEHLSKYLPPGLAFHVIPSGIDLELFRPMPQAEARQRLNLSLDKRFVLFAANPTNPVKRFWLAEAAVALLRDKTNDIELIPLFGVRNEMVPMYMNASDVLILTSHHEGSPNVIKEALACDLPIVSVDVGDVATRISSVPGCVLCRDDKPETLSNGLMQVFQTNRRISGRETVAALHRDLMAQKMIAVYRAALAQYASASA